MDSGESGEVEQEASIGEQEDNEEIGSGESEE